MADPISIIGTVDVVLSVIGVLGKTISTARELHRRWGESDSMLLELASQMGVLRSALSQIKQWLELDLSDHSDQLRTHIDSTVTCCEALAGKIHEQLSDLSLKIDGTLAPLGKMKSLYRRYKMEDLQMRIGRQIDALNFLLTTCNS